MTPIEEKLVLITRMVEHYLDVVLPPDVTYTFVALDKATLTTAPLVKFRNNLTPAEKAQAKLSMKAGIDAS